MASSPHYCRTQNSNQVRIPAGEKLGRCANNVTKCISGGAIWGSMQPVIICVTPDIAHERRMQHLAQFSLAETSGLVLWITTEELLNERGLIAPIWVPGMP
jgi:hypothetical protein